MTISWLPRICFPSFQALPPALTSFPVSSHFPVTKNCHFIPITVKAPITVVESAMHPLVCTTPALQPPCHQTQCLNLTMGGVVAFKSRSCFLLYFLQHLNKCLPRRSGHKQTKKVLGALPMVCSLPEHTGYEREGSEFSDSTESHAITEGQWATSKHLHQLQDHWLRNHTNACYLQNSDTSLLQPNCPLFPGPSGHTSDRVQGHPEQECVLRGRRHFKRQ